LEKKPKKKKNKSKFWLMRMCERKILYNLQQKLTQNLVKVYENAFVAKFSGIWQHSTYKTALTAKNASFFLVNKAGGKGLRNLPTNTMVFSHSL